MNHSAPCSRSNPAANADPHRHSTVNTTANENHTWHIDGSIVRDTNAAGTAMVGALNTFENDSGAGGQAAWAFAVDADTTNGSLRLRVTGEAAHTINWSASIDTMETIA